jgi:hypothetical protein
MEVNGRLYPRKISSRHTLDRRLVGSIYVYINRLYHFQTSAVWQKLSLLVLVIQITRGSPISATLTVLWLFGVNALDTHMLRRCYGLYYHHSPSSATDGWDSTIFGAHLLFILHMRTPPWAATCVLWRHMVPHLDNLPSVQTQDKNRDATNKGFDGSQTKSVTLWLFFLAQFLRLLPSLHCGEKIRIKV